MPRVRPHDRYQHLLQSAAQVFIDSLGYARTQMDDIANHAGVSKGTLYNFFESKEALFDHAVRFADMNAPLEPPALLPVPSPSPGATAEYITQRLATDPDFARIANDLTTDGESEARENLEEIVRQLYRVLNKNRVAIKLIDVCAADHPQLASLWYQSGRGGVMTLLQPYVEQRVASGTFVSVPDPSLAARFILESCMFWAIHIHWDPHPETIDFGRVEDTVVHFVVNGLLPGCG